MKYGIWALLLACTTSAWAVPDWTPARIVKIEPERARVTLDHQRIKSIGMEAMTMPFKVRIRFGNLTMTNHPIHLHGHEFQVTGTDGGPTPKGARWPEVTTDVAVGQMRQIEFVADEEGDWAFHCHKAITP